MSESNATLISNATSSKAAQTKATLVDAALRLASQIGLEGLSIGAIAEVVGMSKSGVFSHFGSRDELQIAVVREYFTRFEASVFKPAMQEARGLARLKALFENWIAQVGKEVDEGCIFISGASEFDDRAGPVRDALACAVSTWLQALKRAIQIAIDQGEFAPRTDARQVQFELHGLILAVHYEARFLKSKQAVSRARRGFQALITRYTQHA